MADIIRTTTNRIAKTLKRHGVQDSQLESEVMVRHALGYDRAQFYAALNEALAQEQLERIHDLSQRRIAGEPLAYILGRREFYGLDFIVSPATLIPRQETELLVETALSFVQECASGITIADIGTGSGAIAIAIASSLPQARVYAIDCSGDALKVADRNRRRHGVADRVCLLRGNLLEPLPCSVDLIVSNPPYIASELICGLPREVRREPRLALDGGRQGLDVISRLMEQAPAKLNAGGRLILEISPEQLDAAREIAQARFPEADAAHRNDLLGLARCLVVSTKG